MYNSRISQIGDYDIAFNSYLYIFNPLILKVGFLGLISLFKICSILCKNVLYLNCAVCEEDTSFSTCQFYYMSSSCTAGSAAELLFSNFIFCCILYRCPFLTFDHASCPSLSFLYFCYKLELQTLFALSFILFLFLCLLGQPFLKFVFQVLGFF